MKIIFDQSAAEKLRDRHTLLELDTVEIQGTKQTVYCLVDDFEFENIHQLSVLNKLHEEFLIAYKQKEYGLGLQVLNKLIELNFHDMNSYYHVMQDRLEKLLNIEKPL